MTMQTPPADPRLAAAVTAHQKGALTRALGLYQQILAANPRQPQVLTFAAAALLSTGQPAKAKQMLTNALMLAPQSAEAHAYMANAHQMTGALDKAAKSYASALKHAPDNAQVHSNLGALLLKQGDAATARDHLTKAVHLQPTYAPAHSNLAQALAKLGDLEAAIAAGREAVRLAPQSAEAQNTLGSALSDAGDFTAAITAFQAALAVQPGTVRPRTNLALAQLRAGDAAAALATCKDALEIQPYSIPALATKSVALTETGQHEAQASLVDLDTYLTVQTIDPGPDYADVDAFNAALCAHILDHPSLEWEPTGHATRKGRHTGDLLAEPKGPFARFEAIINDRIRAYQATLPQADHPVIKAVPKDWTLHVWAVVLEGPGHQIPHIHETGWLSGVYYPKVPPDMGGDDPAGWIEFGKPQDIYAPTRQPPVRLIEPQEGRMVLFPSYYYHRTVPTGSDQLRISIAFDVMPVAA